MRACVCMCVHVCACVCMPNSIKLLGAYVGNSFNQTELGTYISD